MDRYFGIDKPRTGDIGIYFDEENAVHSATVSSVDTDSNVIAAVGIDCLHTDVSETTVQDGWKSSNANIRYFQKGDDERNEGQMQKMLMMFK